ncbi:MAG: phytoene desaturase family protein [Bacteroidia bacterium]|nr:phytoene desaturase family protein [Bacteroidia bacterium]
MKQVVIIGAGLGGLSAAIHLSAKGYPVTLLEKETAIGGKLSERIQHGYRFDTGPSLITMPGVLHELWNTAQLTDSERPTLIPINPICKYFFEDGIELNAWHKPEMFISEVQTIFPNEAKAIQRYLQYSERIYRLTADLFLFNSLHELKTVLSWKALQTLAQIWKIDPFRTVHQANQSFFQSKQLVQLFDRYATYNGSDPYQAPATLNVIPHVEYTMGSYYLSGGLYRLSETLYLALQKLQVSLQLNTIAQKIVHKNKKIVGIETNKGFLPADIVVCNADVVYTFENLLPDFPSKTQKLKLQEPSLSGMVFLWGIKQSFPDLKHHNIFFSKNYEQEFLELKQGQIPQDPTIYISITSKSDPNHAPPNCENWFVLVNLPYLKDQELEETLKIQIVKERILAKLSHRLNCSIAELIETEIVITPEELQRKTFSNRGSIYGIASNNRNAAFNRQRNRSTEIQGLFFAGGSVHPGGGIPLTILSGKIAAKLAIQQNLN